MATYNKKRIDKQQLKEKVAQVAAVAFMQKGIKNVKMDDVAAELGISKRTLYELFSDKEELLLDVVKLHRKEMKNYMISVAEKAENVLEIIMSFYIRTTEDFQTTNILFFEEIKKYPQVTQFLEDGRMENAVSAAMDSFQEAARKSASDNGTSYTTELSKSLEAKGVENLEELQELYYLDAKKEA